jgi:hypothetical protein
MEFIDVCRDVATVMITLTRLGCSIDLNGTFINFYLLERVLPAAAG